MTGEDQQQGSVVDRPDVETLSFEAAQAELEQVVEALEDQNTGLDQALDLWERGERLHAWCQQKLDHAAARMQKLTVSPEEVAAVVAGEPDAFTGASEDADPADAPSMF